MKLENGEIITLDDNKDYIVLKQLINENVNYVYLVTAQKPIEVLVAKLNDMDLIPITDDFELKKVIELFKKDKLVR